MFGWESVLVMMETVTKVSHTNNTAKKAILMKRVRRPVFLFGRAIDVLYSELTPKPAGGRLRAEEIQKGRKDGAPQSFILDGPESTHLTGCAPRSYTEGRNPQQAYCRASSITVIARYPSFDNPQHTVLLKQ